MTLKPSRKIRLIVSDIVIFCRVRDVGSSKGLKIIAMLAQMMQDDKNVKGLGTNIEGTNIQIDLI
jgi:hypothetical protein